MRLRFPLALVLTLAVTSPAPAAVVVVANFTPAEIAFTVADPGGKPRPLKVGPGESLPVALAGPADLTYPARAGNQTVRIDSYNAYVFIPDDKAGRRLEGIELPGKPPERDARPEANPAPRTPVKVRVTLLVDDADPRADRLWQAAVRKRLDDAAAVIEATSTFRLEFAGFATWKSDPTAFDFAALFPDFHDKVKVKPGEIAVGFTSRKLEVEKGKDPKDVLPFGECKGVLASHVLICERRVRSEAEKTDVLTHYLGLALGAVPSPDASSVMRPKLGDGLALFSWYKLRFDPLNALAMNIWADELRRGPIAQLADVSPANRARLVRVYGALLNARPGDPFCQNYLTEFNAEVARAAEPAKKPDAPPDPPEPKKAVAAKAAPGPAVAAEPKKEPLPPARPVRRPRDEVTRQVVRAVVARAKENVGPDRVTGDDLTTAYVRAAADAALKADGDERVSGFLLGLALALDDTGAVEQMLAAGGVRDVESEADRGERLAVLGNPTLRHRRDLSRAFAAGCAAAELSGASAAEASAVDRFVLGRERASGLSFAALAADLSGVSFARRVQSDRELIGRLRDKFSAADSVPATDGLRDGLSWERFRSEFGGATDARFRQALDDVRDRVKRLPANGR